MSAEGFEEWLKAAADQAAQGGPLHLDRADPRCPRDLLNRRRGTDKGDLNFVDRWRGRHANQARESTPACHQWNY